MEAAKAVNRQMLALYYGVGKYVSDNTRKGVWGTGAIETISEQLRRERPGLRGFGVSNIKNMRQFYESWNVAVNRQPTADDLQLTEKEIISPTLTLLNIKRVCQNSLILKKSQSPDFHKPGLCYGMLGMSLF